MSNESSSPEGRLTRLLGFIAHDPDNQALLADALSLAIDLKQVEESRALIDHIKALEAADAAIYAHAAHLSLKLSAFLDAGHFGDLAIAGGITHPAVLYNAAVAHYYSHNFERVVALLEPLADEASASKELLETYVRSLHHLEQTEEAQLYAQKACDLDPGNASLRGLLALIQYENDDNVIALNNAQEALSSNPSQLDALIACASVHFESGNIPASRKTWLHTVDAHPHCGRAWSGLAQVEFNELEFESAQEHLQLAVQYMPDHIGTWHLLAWIYILRSDGKQAREALDKSYLLDRNFGETHGGLAIVDAMDGNLAKARIGIRKALKLNPAGLSARFAELIILQKEGKRAEADQLVKTVLDRQAPGSDVSGATLVKKWLEMHQENAKKAVSPNH